MDVLANCAHCNKLLPALDIDVELARLRHIDYLDLATAECRRCHGLNRILSEHGSIRVRKSYFKVRKT